MTKTQMNKDKKKMEKMTERILNHALQIIYLLTGEEYTIVKKETPHSSIQQLTGEVSKTCNDVAVCFSMEEWEYIDEQKEIYKDMMMEDHQILKSAGIPGNKSSGLHSEILDSVLINQEQKDAKKENDIQQVVMESHPCDGQNNSDIVLETEETEEQCSRGQLEAPEQDIHKGLHNENLYTVSINEDGQYEREEKVPKMKIHSHPFEGISNMKSSSFPKAEQQEEPDMWAYQHVKEEEMPISISEDGSMSWNIPGQDYNAVPYDKKSFACSECGKRFSHKSGLFNHQRIHTGEKAFVCSHCGKCFSRKQYLVRHQRTHTGDKQFACTDCGKCFTDNTHFVIHRRIHTGEKPFTCLVCGKCFTRKEKLNAHLRSHTGEKPFACSVCGKGFTSNAYLVIHQRIHTGEKPYACAECGKCFTQKQHLNTHLRLHT